MRRASASPAACATFSSPTRSRAAFVATTASVVFGVAPNGAPPAARYASASANSPSGRSEEHTSELQSRLHLVCRLLLEKKKKIAEMLEREYYLGTARDRSSCAPL